jgi:hypothetical protein
VHQLRVAQRLMLGEPFRKGSAEVAVGTSLSSPAASNIPPGVRWDEKTNGHMGIAELAASRPSLTSAPLGSQSNTSSHSRERATLRIQQGGESESAPHDVDTVATTENNSPKRTRGGVNVHIDTQSMLKATQTMSKEMKLDRALIALMNILIASSGSLPPFLFFDMFSVSL